MNATFGYTIAWVEDVERALRFYEGTFGLQRRFLQDQGAFQYGELETGATTLAFASNGEADALFPGGYRPNDPNEPPTVIQVSFVTADVEGAFEAALAQGAVPTHAPARQPWGQTVARVRDPNGILVSIVTPLGA